MAEPILPDPPGQRLRAKIDCLVSAVEIGRATAPQVTDQIDRLVQASLFDCAEEAWKCEAERELAAVRAWMEPVLVHRLTTRTGTADAVKMLLDYVDLRAGPPGFMGERP